MPTNAVAVGSTACDVLTDAVVACQYRIKTNHTRSLWHHFFSFFFSNFNYAVIDLHLVCSFWRCHCSTAAGCSTCCACCAGNRHRHTDGSGIPCLCDHFKIIAPIARKTAVQDCIGLHANTKVIASIMVIIHMNTLHACNLPTNAVAVGSTANAYGQVMLQCG